MLATSPKPESSRNYVGLVKAHASLARQSEPPPMPSPFSQDALHFCHLAAESQSTEKMGGGASEKLHLLEWYQWDLLVIPIDDISETYWWYLLMISVRPTGDTYWWYQWDLLVIPTGDISETYWWYLLVISVRPSGDISETYWWYLLVISVRPTGDTYWWYQWDLLVIPIDDISETYWWYLLMISVRPTGDTYCSIGDDIERNSTTWTTQLLGTLPLHVKKDTWNFLGSLNKLRVILVDIFLECNSCLVSKCLHSLLLVL